MNDILKILFINLFALQTSLYYHAIEIYTAIHPHENRGIAPVFLNPPMSLIEWTVNFIQNGTVPLSKETQVRFHIDKFQATEMIIGDFVQAKTLQDLGAGIDTQRFLNDPEYKKDSVLGLAMFTEPKVFDLAVSLAKKYNVNLWQVYMTHLQFLFDSDFSTTSLKKEIEHRNLLEHLKPQSEEFNTIMNRDVLFTVNGSDYDRLRLFYSLLQIYVSA